MGWEVRSRESSLVASCEDGIGNNKHTISELQSSGVVEMLTSALLFSLSLQ